MLEKVEAVIFDFDGTIIDTEKLYYETMVNVFKEYKNIEFDKIEYINKVSGTNTETCRKYFEEVHNVDNYPELEKIITRRLVSNYDKAEILPGVEETLKLLKSNNIRVAIASNGTRDHIEDGLKFKGLDQYIDLIVTKEDVANPKPAPDIYLLAAKKLNANIKNVITVEDSRPGSLAAASSGSYLILQTNDITKYMNFSGVNYSKKDCDLYSVVKNMIMK